MIVRILGEGQYELPDKEAAKLEKLDKKLMSAVEDGNDEAFRSALGALIGEVRKTGKPVAVDYLGPSDLALPGEGSTKEEVRSLLSDEGAIPD